MPEFMGCDFRYAEFIAKPLEAIFVCFVRKHTPVLLAWLSGLAGSYKFLLAATPVPQEASEFRHHWRSTPVLLLGMLLQALFLAIICRADQDLIAFKINAVPSERLHLAGSHACQELQPYSAANIMLFAVPEQLPRIAWRKKCPFTNGYDGSVTP